MMVVIRRNFRRGGVWEYLVAGPGDSYCSWTTTRSHALSMTEEDACAWLLMRAGITDLSDAVRYEVEPWSSWTTDAQ